MAVALALLMGCAPSAPPAPPASSTVAPLGADDAVLRVSGYPLSAAEIERLADGVALLYPEYARAHARRLALTNELLPRLAARALQPERWEAARAACAAAFEGGPPAPLGAEGNFHELGLGLWDEARRLEPGVWSAPLELFGHYVRVRLEGRDGNADPRAERLQVTLLEFPYLERAEAATAREFALDRAVLEVLDPTWREFVPEIWQHRLRPDKP